MFGTLRNRGSHARPPAPPGRRAAQFLNSVDIRPPGPLCRAIEEPAPSFLAEGMFWSGEGREGVEVQYCYNLCRQSELLLFRQMAWNSGIPSCAALAAGRGAGVRWAAVSLSAGARVSAPPSPFPE